MTTTVRDEELWARVHGEMLSDLDALTDLVVARLRRELAHYASVDAAQIRKGAADNIQRATRALVERRRPGPEELAAAGAVGVTRARQGIPVDELLRGFRIAAQELWAEQRRRATTAGLNAADQLDAARIIWEWVDDVLAHAAAAHRQVELELAGHDQHQRARLLRALQHGSLTQSDLGLLVTCYGLSFDRRYHAVQARPPDDPSATALLARLAGPDRGVSSFVGRLDGDLVGIVPAPPRGDLPVPVGLGPALPLAEAHRSFEDAGTALATATAFRLPGVNTVDGLGIRVAVVTRPEIGHRLAERYLSTQRHERASADPTLVTLTAYFANGMRVHPTAETLYLHPNTVRYRLRRFEEAVGADLGRTEDAFAVWWALRHLDTVADHER